MVDSKTCHRCRESRSVEHFSKSSSRRDGLQDECKACNSIRCRENYQANRAYRNRTGRRWARGLSPVTPSKQRRWTAAEDEIAMREDLTTQEKCYLLMRTYDSIKDRQARITGRRVDA